MLSVITMPWRGLNLCEAMKNENKERIKNWPRRVSQLKAKLVAEEISCEIIEQILINFSLFFRRISMNFPYLWFEFLDILLAEISTTFFFFFFVSCTPKVQTLILHSSIPPTSTTVWNEDISQPILMWLHISFLKARGKITLRTEN